jgi:hypothetical protein
LPKRPVLFLDLDKIDKNVLAPEPDSRVKAVGNGLVERLFLLRAPSLVPGDLYNDEVIAAVDTNIMGSNKKLSASCSLITWNRSFLGTPTSMSAS